MSTELAVRDEESTAIVDAQFTPDWTPEIVVSMQKALDQIDKRREFLDKVLSKVEGALVDIPGNDKKALGKPGAEVLLNIYTLTSESYEERSPVLDWGDGTHEPLFMFWSGCRIWKQTGPGEHDRMLVADAHGVCHSRETKYRYREMKRTCPKCRQAAIIKGKEEYGGGWVCFRKQGGCNTKFKDGDQAIEGQKTGLELNPEVADLLNTLLQMADKRALVAATRRATGWSDLVTEEFNPETAGQSTASSSSAQNHTFEPGSREHLITSIVARGLADPAVRQVIVDEVKRLHGPDGKTNNLTLEEATALLATLEDREEANGRPAASEPTQEAKKGGARISKERRDLLNKFSGLRNDPASKDRMGVWINREFADKGTPFESLTKLTDEQLKAAEAYVFHPDQPGADNAEGINGETGGLESEEQPRLQPGEEEF